MVDVDSNVVQVVKYILFYVCRHCRSDAQLYKAIAKNYHVINKAYKNRISRKSHFFTRRVNFITPVLLNQAYFDFFKFFSFEKEINNNNSRQHLLKNVRFNSSIESYFTDSENNKKNRQERVIYAMFACFVEFDVVSELMRRIIKMSDLFENSANSDWLVERLILKKNIDFNFILAEIFHCSKKKGLCEAVVTDDLFALLMHKKTKSEDAFFSFLVNKKTPLLHALVRYCSFSTIFFLIHDAKNMGFVNVADRKDRNALYYAVKYNKITSFLLLLSLNIDYNHTDAFGENVFCYAARFKNEAIFIISTILNIDCTNTTKDGDTILTTLVNDKQFRKFLILISKKQKMQKMLNTPNREGNTPVHLFVMARDRPMLKLWLRNFKNLNIYTENNKRLNPLQIAAINNDICLSKMLLDYSEPPTIVLTKSKSLVELTTDYACKALFKCLHNSHNIKNQIIFKKDISEGLENNPLPLINDNELTKYPQINYTRTYKFYDQKEIFRDVHTKCECVGDCLDNPDCPCWRQYSLYPSKPYSKEGLVDVDFVFSKNMPLVYECNAHCSCSRCCSLRLVQNGIKHRLGVVLTEKMGYSLVALERIPKGAFVVEYAGLIMRTGTADNHDRDEYLLDVDTRRHGDPFCIDALFNGNAARFVNHSCEPNVDTLRVFYDFQDTRIPHVVYVAMEDILPGKSICSDYGDTFWVKKDFGCECNTKSCKYRKSG